MRTITSKMIAAVVSCAAALAACSDSTAPSGTANVSLNVATLTAGAPSGQLSPAFEKHVSGGTGGGAHTIVITSAQLVLSRLELATATAAPCVADDNPHADDRCHELKGDPILLNLPIDNSVVSVLTLHIPAGTYSALEAKLHAVRSTDAGASPFLAAHPDFAGVSVRVQGTFDGAPFTYSGNASASLELDFSPPISIRSAATSLTVHIALDNWFKDRSGNLLDPRVAANANAIDDNIHRSFHAFEDRERRGDDGHGENENEHEHGSDG